MPGAGSTLPRARRAARAFRRGHGGGARLRSRAASRSRAPPDFSETASSSLLSVVITGTTNGGESNRHHPAKQLQGAVLVERLVQVPALRGLHARRAAVVARAALQQSRGVGRPALEGFEASFRDPDTARVPVVDEDRRLPGLEVEVRREAADVPAVA